MSKAKVLKSLIKKAKKPSGIKKSAPRYVKTASGMKPKTKEEEYRNADVPMPKKKKEDTDDKEFLAHLKKFFKG